MNKSIIVILITTTLSIHNILGQESDAGIISAAGGYYEGDNISLEFNLGEWTILNMENSTGQIGNGIYTKYYKVVNISEPNSEIVINIYPNPSASTLYLDYSSYGHRPANYIIVNADGRIFSKGKLNSNTQVQEIDLTELNENVYYLNLVNDDDSILKTLKFIKIN